MVSLSHPCILQHVRVGGHIGVCLESLGSASKRSGAMTSNQLPALALLHCAPRGTSLPPLIGGDCESRIRFLGRPRAQPFVPPPRFGQLVHNHGIG